MLRFSMFIQLLWRSCYTRSNILHISLWYDTTTQNRIVNSWLKFWISGVWITIRRLCWVQGFKNHCTVGHFLGHPLCFNFKISKIICETFNSPFSKSIALCFTNLHLCDLFNICPQSAMFARNLFSQFSQRLNFRRWKGFWNFGAPPPPFYRQNPQRSIWHDIWEQKQIKQFFLWIFWKVTRCKRRCPSQEP